MKDSTKDAIANSIAIAVLAMPVLLWLAICYVVSDVYWRLVKRNKPCDKGAANNRPRRAF